MSNIVLNTDNVMVAGNELVTRFSINRNLRKLLQNDKALSEFYTSVFSALDIKEYISPSVSGSTYSYDDIVWFKDAKDDLWLLRCIIDQNANSPQLAIDDPLNGNPDFQKYGWEDENEYIDIFGGDLMTQMDRTVRQQLALHTSNSQMHRFGKLSTSQDSENYIGGKVMYRDLSNIDEKRENYFFPGKTGHFTTDSVIDGIYRVWDCGLIEFDITFRVGWQETNSLGQDVLECNDVIFRSSTARSKTSKEYTDNSMYFQTTDDMRIFTNPDGMQTYDSENSSSVQKNRNKYVNTYFAQIDFFPSPIEFNGHKIDCFLSRDYTVFCQNQLCQDGKFEDATLTPASNQMSWCDRTLTGIKAIYITYPSGSAQDDDAYTEYAKNGGLASNSFTCHVVGRWNTSK